MNSKKIIQKVNQLQSTNSVAESKNTVTNAKAKTNDRVEEYFSSLCDDCLKIALKEYISRLGKQKWNGEIEGIVDEVISGMEVRSGSN